MKKPNILVMSAREALTDIYYEGTPEERFLR